MAISLKRIHQLKNTNSDSIELEAMSNLHQVKNISSLGNFTFSKDELTTFGFMNDYETMDLNISVDEIKKYVDSLRNDFNKEYSEKFFDEQKNTIIHVVVDRFGLGGIMASNDKTGGNVDTIHNVREGVYATEQERSNYENKPEYDSKEYHSDNRYIEKNRQGKIEKSENRLQDGYTENQIKQNQDYDLDHIKSAKSIHDDAGRILAEKDGVDLANRDENFEFTDRSINRSKKQKSAEQYANELDSTRSQRQDRIAELKQKKDNITEKEKAELNKLEKLESVNTNTLRKKGEKAEKAYEKEINQYYCSKKFITNLGKQSAMQGAQMGVRQVIGVFLTEAISAIFDEIKDACRKIKSTTKSWYESLKERIERIIKRLIAKWKDALQAGFTGVISGFFSNILTVIINIFVTTAKNIVRIIREGFFSLVRAIKLLLNPPEGMSRNQLLHEVGKLIITGIIVVLGVLAEETVDKLPPMMAIKSIPVVGELLTDIIWGFFVALATSLALWGWDKLDIFNAKLEQQHQYIIDILNNNREKSDKEYIEWLEKIKTENTDRYEYLKNELQLI
jgi:hypothetical protein